MFALYLVNKQLNRIEVFNETEFIFSIRLYKGIKCYLLAQGRKLHCCTYNFRRNIGFAYNCAY